MSTSSSSDLSTHRPEPNSKTPWLQRARDWLKKTQNEDDGWGERCNTYDDPIYKAQGPSTASQTAWAVMGLQSFGEPNDENIRHGIEFLLHTQNRDGSWAENETTGTGFPRVFYLKYDSYRNAWPLLALSEQRDLEKLQLGRKHKKLARSQNKLASASR